MSLKTNLANISNAQNINVSGLDDTQLDNNFATSLESLIKGWVSDGKYDISLSNSKNNPKNEVLYTVTTTTDANTPMDDDLVTYVNNTINPELVKGKLLELIVNKTNKTIGLKPKENENNNSVTTTTTTSSASDSNIKSDVGGVVSQQDIDKMVYTQATDQAKNTAESIKKHKILEEIKRMKKLMNL